MQTLWLRFGKQRARLVRKSIRRASLWDGVAERFHPFPDGSPRQAYRAIREPGQLTMAVAASATRAQAAISSL